jgi:hypothetical protein
MRKPVILLQRVLKNPHFVLATYIPLVPYRRFLIVRTQPCKSRAGWETPVGLLPPARSALQALPPLRSANPLRHVRTAHLSTPEVCAAVIPPRCGPSARTRPARRHAHCNRGNTPAPAARNSSLANAPRAPTPLPNAPTLTQTGIRDQAARMLPQTKSLPGTRWPEPQAYHRPETIRVRRQKTGRTRARRSFKRSPTTSSRFCNACFTVLP